MPQPVSSETAVKGKEMATDHLPAVFIAILPFCRGLLFPPCTSAVSVSQLEELKGEKELEVLERTAENQGEAVRKLKRRCYAAG